MAPSCVWWCGACVVCVGGSPSWDPGWFVGFQSATSGGLVVVGVGLWVYVVGFVWLVAVCFHDRLVVLVLLLVAFVVGVLVWVCDCLLVFCADRFCGWLWCSDFYVWGECGAISGFCVLRLFSFAV